MKKIIPAIIAAFMLSFVSAPVASAVTTQSEPTVVQAKKSDYKKKNRNRYWRALKSEDGDFRIIGKKDAIDMGVATCDLLRAGGDLFDLSMLVVEADPIIEDLLIVSFAYAPIYLCPDQAYKFED